MDSWIDHYMNRWIDDYGQMIIWIDGLMDR